jgi:hypothetical protein
MIRRPKLFAAVVIGWVIVGLSIWAWVDWKRGLPRDEEISRLKAILNDITTPEEAEAKIEGCITRRFPNNEWVTGIGIDGHSWRRAANTLVVRDSRGQVKAFVGAHICGPRWMENGPYHDQYLKLESLDDFYNCLAKLDFREYSSR